MADRPGIMFYFDILDDLEDFTSEEIGDLFIAMMKYGRTGEVAEFSDRGMRSIWRSMMKYVDRDQARFDDKILQKRYAGWKSAMKRKEILEKELPSYEEWKADPQSYEDWKPSPSPSTTVNDRQRPSTTVDETEHPLTAVNQLSTINYQQSAINNQPSTVNSQLSEINEDGERVQGEGDQPAGKAASSTAVSDLVQAFDYAFENNMIPEIVRIREKLHSLGYDPKGNRIADV